MLISELAIAKKNYPLQKVIAYVLDKGELDHENVQINIDDPKKWDFVYADIDKETMLDAMLKGSYSDE